MQGEPRRRRLARLLVGVVVLVSLTGCTKAASAAPATTGDVLAEALSDAKSGGAGEAQIAALEAAAQAGSLSLEAARDAARRSVTCMNDAGIKATYQEQSLTGGLVVPGYSAVTSSGSGSSTEDAAIDACVTRESFWINKVLQVQPSSVQQREDFANQQAPVLRKCLESHGIKTDPDADGVELANQALDARKTSGASFDCLHEAGIDQW